MKHKTRLSVAESHQLKIALDTVRNLNKALLGGPSLSEAKAIISKLIGLSSDDSKPFCSFKESHGV
jgi:hypothetical protein